MFSCIGNSSFSDNVHDECDDTDDDIIIWDYRVFGLRPSSRILQNTKEHNVSETVSVSILR
jgi:hypothetical protein